MCTRTVFTLLLTELWSGSLMNLPPDPNNFDEKNPIWPFVIRRHDIQSTEAVGKLVKNHPGNLDIAFPTDKNCVKQVLYISSIYLSTETNNSLLDNLHLSSLCWNIFWSTSTFKKCGGSCHIYSRVITLQIFANHKPLSNCYIRTMNRVLYECVGQD